MKEIQLTQEQIAIVDEWNYKNLNQYKMKVSRLIDAIPSTGRS